MKKSFLSFLILIWYFVSASIESILYLKYRKRAKGFISYVKKDINDTRQLEEWYEKNKFSYIADKIDIRSFPWVVVSKLGGDCEDFMSLSYEILKSKYKECYRVLIYSTYKGIAHAVLIVKEKDNSYTIMSNGIRIKNFKSIEVAVKHFYNNDTKKVIYL